MSELSEKYWEDYPLYTKEQIDQLQIPDYFKWLMEMCYFVVSESLVGLKRCDMLPTDLPTALPTISASFSQVVEVLGREYLMIKDPVYLPEIKALLVICGPSLGYDEETIDAIVRSDSRTEEAISAYLSNLDK